METKTGSGSKKVLFEVDPSFCPYCGSILPLPDTTETIVCRLCKYVQESEIYENHVEYTIKHFNVAKKRDKGFEGDVGDGPLVDRKCLNCGHDEMTYTTQQTRSADEGQTVFYTCPKCKYKETENS